MRNDCSALRRDMACPVWQKPPNVAPVAGRIEDCAFRARRSTSRTEAGFVTEEELERLVDPAKWSTPTHFGATPLRHEGAGDRHICLQLEPVGLQPHQYVIHGWVAFQQAAA
jgi:hypothetical protein